MNLSIFGHVAKIIIDLITKTGNTGSSVLELATNIPALVDTAKSVVAMGKDSNERTTLMEQILEEFDNLTGKDAPFRIISILTPDDEETILDAIKIILRESLKKVL